MKSRNNKLQSAARKKEAQGGSSCHQCKSRRNCSDLTYCTSNLDKKKKQKCRKKYCEHCLRKFYRESPAQINEKPTWKCPSCRKICCCAACRRREMRDKVKISLELSLILKCNFADNGLTATCMNVHL